MTTPAAARPDLRHIEPLWDRIDRNRWRLTVYLVAFWLISSVWTGLGVWVVSAVLWFWTALLFERPPGPPTLPGTWIVGGFASLAYVGWTLARSDRWIRRKLRAEIVPKGALYDTKMVVKDMAIAAGMPVAPALYSVPSGNVNAFVFHAVGRRPIIGVTEGFSEKLSLEQQRGVFANLIARLVTRDTLVASAVSVLMAPLNAWRDHRLTVGDDDRVPLLGMAPPARQPGDRTAPQSDALLLLLFGPGLALLGEVIAAAFRRSQVTGAEKADAEGMLLLKDPQAMLSALEGCIGHSNTVVEAGDALGPLFYCWTGTGPVGEEDPAWHRVGRLREVLGVEGLAAEAGGEMWGGS